MESQIKFAEKYIFPKIIAESEKHQELKFIKSETSTSTSINGFKGNIIFANLEFGTKDQKKVGVKIVVKLMKPPSLTRTELDLEQQFANEVFIYENVIPTFISKFQAKFKVIDKHLWSPRTYLTEIGKYPELSDETETILVMEDLSGKNFRLGPRLNLTAEELTLMTKAIAQYHACTYALRINNDPDHERLTSGIIHVGFERKSGKSPYHDAYATALQRLFTYLENNPEEIDSEMFAKNLNILKTKYRTDPLKLMERFFRSDKVFRVILHGDYNRNNVLFKYEENTAVDLRFIDFQEVRYGSPAIDLSFFMYMNVHPDLFEAGFNENLLKLYHEHLTDSLCELLDCQRQDKRLSPYNWDNFHNHFKQFALYGAMVSMMFLPWMACPEDECAEIVEEMESERDMFSEKLRELLLTCGGKEVDQRIVAVLRHACKSEYMEMMAKDD